MARGVLRQIQKTAGTGDGVLTAVAGSDTLPTLASGARPSCVRFTASVGLYGRGHVVGIGLANGAGDGDTATGFPLMTGESVIVNVTGFTHYNWGVPTAAAVFLSVSPLENQ